MSTPTGAIYRYYLYRAFAAEGFVYPIITIYALAQGLDLADVGLATGAFFLGRLAGEIPTGYIGDRIGRRNGLIVGSLLLSVTHVGFALSETLVAFVVIYGFWGFAGTFRSGTGDAWLYDLLDDHDATAAFTRIRGRSTGMFYLSAATTALAGGVLYEFNQDAPFFAAAISTTVAAAVVSTLPVPEITSTQDRFSLVAARETLRTIVTVPRLRFFVLMSGIVLAVPETVEVFVQPIATDLGFRPSSLGPLYAGLMGTAAAGSWLASSIERAVGISKWFLLAPAGFSLLLLTTIPLPIIALPAFFVSRGFNTATETLATTFVNEQIASIGRATLLSGVSMVYALLYFLARATGGTIADRTTPLIAISLVGVVSVVVVVSTRLGADPFGY
ncbi:MAG: MFS transporter [Halobacteriales archaeon]